MLHKLQSVGLRVEIEKCKFFEKRIAYLGFIIDANGLHTSEDKVEAILKAKVPSNVKELQSFLGLVNYYGKFLSNLSTLLHPLYYLLQKHVKWFCGKKAQDAYDTVKRKLASVDFFPMNIRMVIHDQLLMRHEPLIKTKKCTRKLRKRR